MTGTVYVTAGPHDVGFTWRERPGQRQDVWQPSLRDSQEVHMIGGLPRLKTVGIEGPYNVKGVSSTPSRERVFVCTPAAAADETACAQQHLHQPRPARLPAAGHGRRRRGADGVLQAGARDAAATSTPASAPAWRACWPARPSSTESSATRPACGPARRTPVSDVELASRLSFFLWSSIPDERLLNLATAGTPARSRACWRRRCGA